MAITRDFINPIMKNVPAGARPKGFIGAPVMAFIAAINPKSNFTQPYFGAFSWLILSWFFYNISPLGMVRPSDPNKKTLISGNPKWYQIVKSLIWGFVFNFIPMFFFYSILLILARVDAKIFA